MRPIFLVLSLFLLFSCATDAGRSDGVQRSTVYSKDGSCWDGQSDSGDLLVVAPDKLIWDVSRQPTVAILIRVANGSDEIKYVNQRTFVNAGFLPGDFEVWLRIRAPNGQIWSRSDGVRTLAHGDTARESDYGQVAPGDSIKFAVTLAVSDYPLDPGEYSVEICFWDQGTVFSGMKARKILRGPAEGNSVKLVVR